jgi:probable O-glycosylation ligase (exosortase A-associated)
MIADNNHLGLALVMVIPLLNYLRLNSRHWLITAGCAIVALMAIFTVVGTYSRGGFIALLAISVAFWLRSKRRLALLGTALAFALLLPNVMPEDWYNRMATIEGYAEDPSVAGRFAAWEASWNLALARPITGGGFRAIEITDVFLFYNPDAADRAGTAAHSIYFQTLGDHGFIGLLIYLAILLATWRNLRTVIAQGREKPELQWAVQLASMMQVSLIGFVVAGVALSMAYYDVTMALIALSIVLRGFVTEPVKEATGRSLSFVLPTSGAGSGLAVPRWRQRR